MLASTSGRSIFGFSTDPRSPPVQVTTWTSTPSATYFAVVAAPLLDSSSGWACTCASRGPERAGRDGPGCPAGAGWTVDSDGRGDRDGEGDREGMHAILRRPP